MPLLEALPVAVPTFDWSSWELFIIMGACGSTEAGGEDMESKKRSQAIDKRLEEDSRRLRRECKILLLGAQCTCIALLWHANAFQDLEKAASRRS